MSAIQPLGQTSVDQSTTGQRRVSVICPIHNEEVTIPIFYERFCAVRAPLSKKYEIELIFTNNRSSDRSLDIITEIRNSDRSVQVITLSRNFGYQASLQAGLAAATGDAVMIIDVDCEDPPEMLPEFLSKWEEGYDIVYGERGGRPEWIVVKKLRDYFYHVMRSMADSDIILYMAEFSLFSRAVRDAAINNLNTMPYLRAEIAYAGFSRYGIPYNRQERVHGTTHYNIFDMFAVGIGAILTSSTILLRFSAEIFIPILILNFVLFGLHLSSGADAWFTSLVVIDLIYISAQISVHGLYLARIHKNVMGRPVYLIDMRHTYVNERAEAAIGLGRAAAD